MTSNRGFGKVILFNEHFVVYGIPAIVSAIDKSTTARVEPWDGEDGEEFIPGVCLVDRRKETPGYKASKLDQQRDSLRRMLISMGIDPTDAPIKIYLEGDLVAASGIGASAASCTAIARALSTYYRLNLDDVRINEIAYEGEKGYHGTPSGIDNTAATFGGLIWFKRGDPSVLERLSMREKVEIVMGNTGLVANTSAAVAGVRERKEREPEKYARIFAEAEKMVHEARVALLGYDLKRIGELMNRNHELLQAIEVSCQELDLLVNIARDHGALGAKLTGGGLGGNMVALTPGKDLQERVARAIEKEGFEALRTRIG